MNTIVYSPKGGQGCTTIAVALARRRGSMLIDTAGDAPAVCGMVSDGPGVCDALQQGLLTPAVLKHLALDGWLVPAGQVDAHRLLLADWLDLAEVAPDAVVDAGTNPTVAAMPGHKVMVVRNCYLALRRAMNHPVRPDLVVMIAEPVRALGCADVEACLGVEVREVPWDPSVARAVDAGLLSVRPPAALKMIS